MIMDNFNYSDDVVGAIVNKFLQRSEVGIVKYGGTLDDAVDPLHRWIEHTQDELMDAILYLEKAKRLTVFPPYKSKI